MEKKKYILENFVVSGGKHCQTTAIRHILAYRGIEFSEDMLFGLGGGIGFLYWQAKNMPAPFIGTRNGKPEDFILDILNRIGLKGRIKQTTNPKKAYRSLRDMLSRGDPAYVFVDMAYLPYLALPGNSHFGAHTVAVYGIDETNEEAYIADRSVKPLIVTFKNLALARNSGFQPFPPKNKIVEINYARRKINPAAGIRQSILSSCSLMLNPPIKNFGLEGMKKWAGLITRWPEMFKNSHILDCLLNTFLYIEIAGTGGSAFRPMYANFIRESAGILNKPGIAGIADSFEFSGTLWSEIARVALPDAFAPMKRIKELLIEKSRIFEDSGNEKLDVMVEINKKLINLAEQTVEEVLPYKDKIRDILLELQRNILKCYDVERDAFYKLRALIK